MSTTCIHQQDFEILFLLFYFLNFLFYVYECAHHAQGSLASNFLLELRELVSHHVKAGN